MSKLCRVGMIGQQFMGRAHSNAFRQVPRFFDVPRHPVLHTIAARDADTLVPFAERWGWQHTTTRWQDIAACDEIDLVDVATPNDVHAKQSVAMLEAGKHVACEKPLAGTLADARAMWQAARRSSAKTFVWFNYRRCPAIALAYEMMRERRLGDIYHVRATYLQSWGGPSTPRVWRFDRRRAGSGAHGDLNAHIVDLARFLLADEITEVSGAIAETFVRERPVPGNPRKKAKSTVDDCVLFLARFKTGAVGSFEATRLATGHHNANRIEINGSRGSLRFDFEDMNLLWFCDASDGPRTSGWRRIMCTSGDAHPYAGAWWPDAHLIGYEHTFTNMAADIMLALSGRKPPVPLPDFEDAYRTQRVLEAALLAARNRAAVKISQVK
jgi:predicted dehydrogenase